MKKIALITGGSSDIGIATAIRFMQEDYFVVINIRKNIYKKIILTKLKNKFILNKDFVIYTADISNFISCNKMFEQVKIKYGKINSLINNASVTDDLKKKNDIKEFKRIFDTNYFGTLNCIFNIISQSDSIKRNIVNLSSENSKRGSLNLPAYASSKAAIDNITLSFSSILAKNNIRINSILPSTVLTKKIISEKKIAKIKKKLPMNRLAQPKEIASIIFWLCNDESSYVSGTLINVNGGNNY